MPAAHTDDTISLDELLAAAAERGYPASPRQAKRLRAEGMLRCLGQDHPAGRRGSHSRYRASEVDQLALVMRVGASERRFDERRVLVAWHGGWVEPNALRGSLAAILDTVSGMVRRAIRDSEDPGHAAELLTRGPRKGHFSPSTGLMRRRLGGDPQALQRATYAFALLAAGGEVAWSEHDPSSGEESLASVLERATGSDRARKDTLVHGRQLAPSAPPVQDTLEELRAAGLFDIEDLPARLRHARPRPTTCAALTSSVTRPSPSRCSTDGIGRSTASFAAAPRQRYPLNAPRRSPQMFVGRPSTAPRVRL